MIYLLGNSRGLECSLLLLQEHFLEAGASRGPLQGVFLWHIPDVLLQLTQGDCCLQRHENSYGEVSFCLFLFLILHSKLQLWMILWSNLQSSADPHKQWHLSPLHRRLIFLQKHQAGWHPMQTPPFFIIPLGFGDLGALFHYTATIISQRKLKSFNSWKVILPKSATA